MGKRGERKLPTLKLDVPTIILHAEARRDLVTFESEVTGVAYVGCVGDGITIVSTNNGFIRLNYEDISTIVEELKEYKSQLDTRRALAR